jgi:sugar phosphate isomerase/epimerase
MNFSFSNLYLDASILVKQLRIIKSFGFDALELAPYHQFGGYVVNSKVLDFKRSLEQNEIKVSGFQGFTFTVNDLKFDFLNFTNSWVQHLINCIRLADIFDSRIFVFGAPGFRTSKEDEAAFVNSFLKTKDFLKLHDIEILLEAVPHVYGTAFLNSFLEVLKFSLDHNCLIHFDTGCYLNENISGLVDKSTFNVEIHHYHCTASDLGLLSRDVYLQRWLDLNSISRPADGYIVLESTVKSNDVSVLQNDLSFIRKFIK